MAFLAWLLACITPAAKAGSVPADGAYVMIGDGCVAIILDGKARWICGEVWENILNKPQNTLVRLPAGAVPGGPPWVPDGTAIRNSAGCVALVWNGEKHWVPADVFPLLKTNGVLQVPDAVFDGLPSGPPADAALAQSVKKVVLPPPPQSAPPPHGGNGDK